MDLRSRARRGMRLRARRRDGCHFRRQSPIGGSIVDFAWRRRRPVVEGDGRRHAERREADATRTAWPERRGYEVIRFWNREVLENIEGVVATIRAALRERDSPPSRPPP